MKSNFLSALLWATLSCCIVSSNAQIGVTKLGTNALSNNGSSGIYNTGIGYNSLYANTTGDKNTGIGANTLRFTTSGVFNTAGGYAALYFNTSGSYNAAYGYYSLFSNTTGENNTAYGTNSLQANVAGSANTSIGYNSLFHNTSSQNTALGYYALYGNTSGVNNTAVGTEALNDNSTGYNNTASGVYSMMQNINGNNNTATGFASMNLNNSGFGNAAYGTQTLYGNTSGSQNTASGLYSMMSNKIGNNNTASGCVSLYSNVSGNFNTASGYGSLYSNNTGSLNTASGFYALITNTSGFNNSAFGYYALATNGTGSYNTAIGDSADVISSNLTNATAIGNKALVDRSNKVRVGNTAVTSIGGQVSWTTFSDGRYKNNISEDVPGLAFINSLRPVTYNVDVKGLNEYYGRNSKEKKLPVDSAQTNLEDKTAGSLIGKADEAAAKIKYSGFVAQEVEAAAKNLNFDFSGVDKPGTTDGLYGLRYDNFVVPLVKAVQELSKQNNALKKELETLKLLVANGNHINGTNTLLSDASFEQNIPNPFGNATTINYNLPRQFSSAKIIITDKNGSTLKEVSLTGKGKGSLQIDSSILASGAYNYSLYVDGMIIGTKQMLLAK